MFLKDGKFSLSQYPAVQMAEPSRGERQLCEPYVYFCVLLLEQIRKKALLSLREILRLKHYYLQIAIT